MTEVSRLYLRFPPLQKTAFDGKELFRLMPFDLLSLIVDCGLALQTRFLPNAPPGNRSLANRMCQGSQAFGAGTATLKSPEVLMNCRRMISATRVLPVLALVLATAAFAQGKSPVHFKGLINDYTASTVKGGPWELHGAWTLDLRGASGTSDFSADLTMSNYGTTNGVVDPSKPGNSPHVHHIVMKGATVQWDMDGCPTFPAPTNNTIGFQITGPVSLLTGNGQPAPFDPAPPQSQLTVCITGVSGVDGSVAFSNITMVLGAPASSHFGVGTVIHGVVSLAH